MQLPIFLQKKIKQFHSSSFFSKRFSSSDHLNVINTKIDICFDNILAKTRRKNDHHKAILRTVTRMPANIGKISLKHLYLS